MLEEILDMVFPSRVYQRRIDEIVEDMKDNFSSDQFGQIAKKYFEECLPKIIENAGVKTAWEYLKKFNRRTSPTVFQAIIALTEDRKKSKSALELIDEYICDRNYRTVCDFIIKSADKPRKEFFRLYNCVRNSPDPVQTAKFIEHSYRYNGAESLENYACELVEMYSKTNFYSDFIKFISKQTRSKEDLEVFKKYFDNKAKTLVFALGTHRRSNQTEFHFDGLLSDRVYSAIEKTRTTIETIQRLVDLDYECRDFIDMDLKKEDVDLVNQTYAFVRIVHELRFYEDKTKVANGFFDELERSMDQGTDYNSKVRNLRVYCNEVQKQMQQNIEELMVMNDVA